MKTIDKVFSEMSTRRHELIALMKKQGGGTVSIQLKADNVEYLYRKERKPEPFYLHYQARGIYQTMDESELIGIYQGRD